jgi:hypothetical protein
MVWGTRARAALPLLVLAAACAGPAAAACAGPAAPAPAAPASSTPRPPASPTPRTAGGPGWAQSLTFAGDVQGAMLQLAPDAGAARSECSGRNSRPAGAWASALFGPVGTDVYEVVVTVRPYRGPGTYRSPEVAVQVSRPDGSAVWQTAGTDPATFTVDPDEESGAMTATLTNLASGATKLRLDGHWSCRT